MIQITKYLKIHILTAVLAVIFILIGRIEYFLVTYTVMAVHEAAHLFAALCIGLRIDNITFFPFGVNLKLKNKIIYSLADEFILYISGPAVNILAAAAALIIYMYYPSEKLYYFYINNFALFAANMLPAMPLDGGVILKRLLTAKLGFKKAKVIMNVLSAMLSFVFVILGIYVVYRTRMNISVLLFAVLLLGNIFTQREKYDEGLVRELLFHKKKNGRVIRHFIEHEPVDYKKLAKKFDMGGYGIVYVLNSRGKVVDILTETEIINSLTDSNVTV